MRKLSKKEYIVAGFLGILALFPLGTDMAVNMMGSVRFPTQTEWSEQRREFNRMRDACNDQGTESGSVVCDPALIRERAKLHKAAEESDTDETESVEAAHASDLSRFERGLIRRAQHAGYCADQLKIIVSGLYELCVRVLRETGTAR